MKDPGEYALMFANGKPWAEIVKAIRLETLAWKRAQDRENDRVLIDFPTQRESESVIPKGCDCGTDGCV